MIESDIQEQRMKIIIENRKSRFNFFILEELEAGIILMGTELKSLRGKKVNLSDAYVSEKNSEMWLNNMHISEYKPANRFNHIPKRARKLLLHKKQINRLIGKVKTSGITIIPLSLYFNDKGIVKVKIVVAKGKKLYDKREAIKKREWVREKSRLNK